MPSGIPIPFPQSFANWLRQKRLAAGFRDQKSFIQALQPLTNPVSATTIKKIESGGVDKYVTKEVLESIGSVLGISWRDIVLATTSCFLDFQQISTLSHEISKQLLDGIHCAAGEVDDQRLYTLYDSILKGAFSNAKISLDSFLSDLNHKAAVEALLSQLPDPTLKIDVDERFRQLTFRHEASKIVVDEPQLLWPCNCQMATGPPLRSNCPIHRHDGADDIENSFLNNAVLIKWRNLGIHWSNSYELFPPSVDSFHMIDSLVEYGLCSDKNLKSVLDLGSGTGFLGIALAQLNPAVTALRLVDWLPTPVLYSAMNVVANREVLTTGTTEVMLGLNLTFHSSSKSESPPYDLVICNPPYLPIDSQFRNIGVSSVVAGTDLIRHLIDGGGSIGRTVIFQCSNLAYEDLRKYVTAANATLEPIGAERRVPFRIRVALTNQAYLQWLIDQHELEVDEEGPYRYWHRIQTFRLA